MNKIIKFFVAIFFLLLPIFGNAQADTLLHFLKPVMGDWYTVADEEMLKKYPEMVNSIGFKFEWSDESRKIIRFYEGVRENDKAKSILETFVTANPQTGEVEFQGYQKQDDFLYRGRYEPLKEGVGFTRIYDVHYPPGTKFRTKREERLGKKTYKTTCRIGSDGKMACNIRQLELGEWVPWGSGKPWYLERRAAANKAIPNWVLEDWKSRTNGNGVWITDNSTYKSDQEPYDAYGLKWEYGLGEKHLKGRLYCIKEGKDVGAVWQFTEFWDPATGTLRVVQIGSDGTVGQGKIWQDKADPKKHKEQQKFVSPSGGVFKAGHLSWKENGDNHTQSYNIVDGAWEKRRLYVWKQSDKVGTIQKKVGKLKIHQIRSKSLANNKIKLSNNREVLVYTPPNYENSSKSFPVLYLLHSYGGNPKTWLESPHTQGFNIQSSLDSLIEEKQLEEFIVVMPDCNTSAGGSWYTNSLATGNWEDFIRKELVNFIDTNYRTIKNPKSRGITGHSMGGYGALKIALKNPDIFGSVYAMSSVNLASDKIAKMKYPELLEKLNSNTPQNEYQLFDKLILSKALAFVPNQKAPYFCDYLYNENKELDASVWQKWQSHLLVNQLKDFKNKNQPLNIKFDHGAKDFLVNESRNFSKKLNELGIHHVFSEYEGDHTNKVRNRMEEFIFPFFSKEFNQ